MKKKYEFNKHTGIFYFSVLGIGNIRCRACLPVHRGPVLLERKVERIS